MRGSLDRTMLTGRRGAVVAMLLLAGGGLSASAQRAPALPFAVGEEFVYRVRVGRLGTVGSGTMSVGGPVEVRGTRTLPLRFEFSTRVGPIRAVNRSESWLDTGRMASVRFTKHERHPLSRHDEEVELFPSERRWTAADGTTGSSPSSEPLDELSFLYFIRTLPLEPGSVHRFDRHFETDRNPVTVLVLGRETIEVGAGSFATVVVEMRVRDPRRYREEEGAIRIHLSDDELRIPVRIESSVPVLGTAVLTLETASGAQKVVHAR